MLTFYGTHKNGLWYISDKCPTSGAYITIVAETRHDAECQLFEMVAAS